MVGDVARSLSFAPLLEGMAQRILVNMTQSGRVSFNAAHLRIEKDARDWSIILGGEAVGCRAARAFRTGFPECQQGACCPQC